MIPFAFPSDWLPLLVGALVLLAYLIYATVQKSSTGTHVLELHFSPDGQVLYGGGVDSPSFFKTYGRVWAWEVSTGRLLWQQETEGPISVLELSPLADSLLTASLRGTVVEDIWGGAILRSLETGESLFPLTDARGARTTNVYFPPGSQQVFGCYKKGIQVWDAATGQRLAFWSLPESERWQPVLLHFSEDGSLLLVNGSLVEDGKTFLQLWDAGTGACLQKFPAEEATQYALAPGGNRVVLARRHSPDNEGPWDITAKSVLELYAADGQLLSKSSEIPIYHATALAFLPEGAISFEGYSSTGEQGIQLKAFLWDTYTGQLTEQSASVTTKEFLSPDGQLRAVANIGGYQHRPPLVTLYRTDTGEKLRNLEGLAGR